ncbi:flagellar brake protein, partial [Escherichia coli]|nr:flagellar brake protein [Escherichia coli]
MNNYSEQFLKNNPLAVLGVLRDLQKNDVPVRISWGNNQFISKILDLSPDNVIIDLGSQDYENRAVLRAESLCVTVD